MDKRIELLRQKIDKIEAENMALTSTAGGRIKKARKDAGLIQQDLADLLGLERTSVANIENNKQTIMTQHLIKICNTFKLSADYVLGIYHINSQNSQVLGMERPIGDGYNQHTTSK